VRPIRVVDRCCLNEFEGLFSPKLTLAHFIPETTYGHFLTYKIDVLINGIVIETSETKNNNSSLGKKMGFFVIPGISLSATGRSLHDQYINRS
jgi:hypothetical protein